MGKLRVGSWVRGQGVELGFMFGFEVGLKRIGLEIRVKVRSI